MKHRTTIRERNFTALLQHLQPAPNIKAEQLKLSVLKEISDTCMAILKLRGRR